MREDKLSIRRYNYIPYDPNPTDSFEFGLSEKNLDYSLSEKNLDSDRDDKLNRSIYDCKNKPYQGTELILKEGQYPSKDQSANEVYEHLGNIDNFYKKVFGRNSIDNRGFKIVANVHFDIEYETAFWSIDKKQIFYGEGDASSDRQDFYSFTSCIDVSAHAFAHGMIQYESKLNYAFETGALCESIADVFAIMVRQYINEEKSDESRWLLGRELLATSLNPPNYSYLGMRSLKTPGQANICDLQVAHMDDYRVLPEVFDNGGVHINSGIPNKAFYLLATALGGYSWNIAGKIWYNALVGSNLTSSTTFKDFAYITVSRTRDKFGQRFANIVADSWSQVGIHVSL
ncbi:M4 family metallopeptidase [Xenorhabdus sp. 12]|uniref:Neutral metalloproteinase n=1 Tax=Xenorhabdus santafensis TaxID=2582833 RepID=A0ABU4S8I9_9GAMM|nr:M4 family metallopeptidase [Xenorhabdus sp. 12]MDX7987092.1 M4 family metallopeptidase [Xenorhabdus sp. 12]